uniref:RRM domain-containing protein n=1 Tax=Bionectria ochroleuca TaxID=29856 RepID=A0A8H7TNR7_BIOOC
MEPRLESSTRVSRSSSNASRKSNLTLDLSILPPLSQPTPPSNTLIFTNLNDLAIFGADSLASIRDLISRTATIHTWAPLKSFRRIIVSFYDEEAAIKVRQVWDGENVSGSVSGSTLVRIPLSRSRMSVWRCLMLASSSSSPHLQAHPMGGRSAKRTHPTSWSTPTISP